MGKGGVQVAEEERLGGGITKRLESRRSMYKIRVMQHNYYA